MNPLTSPEPFRFADGGHEGSICRWLVVSHPAASSLLAECLRPAPHAVSVGAQGACVRIREVAHLVDQVPDDLLPLPLAKASPTRRRAFAAGRLCAEYAACRIGWTGPVTRGPGGEPVWPRGLLGSITHNDAIACAIVAGSPGLLGIGIDSEPIAHGDALGAIESLCCTERERRTWLRRETREVAGTLLFSAKESLYKAMYPLVRRFVDFLEVEAAELDWSRGTLLLRAVPGSRAALTLRDADCRFVLEDGMVHTSVVLDGTFPAS